jgi:type IV pilus assembly protein PilX
MNHANPRNQQGVALIVAMLLLIVIALVGLAASRGTFMQQKIATNQYDRQVAFQNAEAAMRVAAERIATNPGEIARNCQAGGTVCLTNPFDDENLPSGGIHTVATGTGSGEYTAGAVAAGQPQYVIENMGNWHAGSTDTGFGQSANAAQYGAQGISGTAVYYRITARSGDPIATNGRAYVVLQAMIKQS